MRTTDYELKWETHRKKWVKLVVPQIWFASAWNTSCFTKMLSILNPFIAITMHASVFAMSSDQEGDVEQHSINISEQKSISLTQEVHWNSIEIHDPETFTLPTLVANNRRNNKVRMTIITRVHQKREIRVVKRVVKTGAFFPAKGNQIWQWR